MIEVKRKSGKKVKGYISEVEDDLFVIADTAAASSYDVRYSEVNSVKPYQLPTGGDTKKLVIIGGSGCGWCDGSGDLCLQTLQALGAGRQDLPGL